MTKENNKENVAKAHLTSLRTGTRKLNLVAGLIRNLPIKQALFQLQFCKRRISNDVLKCLESAIANADNNHNMDVDALYVSEVLVGKAMVMKRFRARARGRGARVEKPFSKLSIILKEMGS